MELTDAIRKSIRDQLTAKPKAPENPRRHYYRFNRGRPFYSDALGVNPDQVEEARANLRKHGVTADIMPDGTVKIESEKQFRDVAKACGWWNGKDGFAMRDSSGNRVLTGREQQRARQELRQRILRGEFD